MANSCETCKHYEVEAYNEPCVSCRFRDYDVPTKWENPFKQKTNADSIRAMSDEELAQILIHYNAERDVYVSDDMMAYFDWDSAVNAELEWLKQPAEKEENPQGDK